MSDFGSRDAARAARIDDQFDEIYRFLRDLIDDPTPLRLIPDGSELLHRTIQWNDQRVQLTAHRLSGSDEPWTARVTSWNSTGGLGLDSMSLQEGQSDVVPAPTASAHPEEQDFVVQTAETADAALDALEQMILQRQVQVASA